MPAKGPIGESYFFRDKGQFALLREQILPALIAEGRPARRLHLWSAGCARGEEPYSLAILLDELLPDRPAWDLLILGSDSHPEFITEAREACYGSWSLRGLEPAILDRYFHLAPTRAGRERRCLDAAIRPMVTFETADLLSQMPSRDQLPMDIILCRNVFIYFEPEAVARAVARFAGMLRPGGYLLTGHGELQGVPLAGLQPRLLPGSAIFQRPPMAATQPVLMPPPRPPLPPRAKPRRHPSPARQPPATITPSPLTEARALYAAGRYRLALRRAAQAADDPVVRYEANSLMARALANLGEHDEANRMAQAATRLRPLAAEPYFIQGLVAEERGEAEAARRFFEQAIYLEPAHLRSLVALASLRRAAKDPQGEIRLLRVARRLLAKEPDDQVVDPLERLTAGGLRRWVDQRLKERGE